MKIRVDRRDAPTSLGGKASWLAGCVACLTAALALTATAYAGTPGGNDNTGGDAPGVSAGGDETVGTLPVVGGRQIALPVVRGWRGDHPAFYVEGYAYELNSIILGARGRGFASVEVVDLSTHRLRIAFHGDVTVVLDRQLTSSFPIQTGLAVPASFGQGQATVAWGAGTSRSVRLRTGLLPLALGSMSANGSLEQGPLQISAAGSRGRSIAAAVYATPATLVVRQSN